MGSNMTASDRRGGNRPMTRQEAIDRFIEEMTKTECVRIITGQIQLLGGCDPEQLMTNGKPNTCLSCWARYLRGPKI